MIYLHNKFQVCVDNKLQELLIFFNPPCGSSVQYKQTENNMWFFFLAASFPNQIRKSTTPDTYCLTLIKSINNIFLGQAARTPK
jgi:hypothetical protein